jgi:hypothetical protein
MDVSKALSACRLDGPVTEDMLICVTDSKRARILPNVGQCLAIDAT